MIRVKLFIFIALVFTFSATDAQFNSFSIGPRVNLGYFVPPQTTIVSGTPFLQAGNIQPLSFAQVINNDGQTRLSVLHFGGYGAELFYNRKTTNEEFKWSIGGSFFVQKHLFVLDVPDFDFKGSRSDAILDHYKYLAYKLCIRRYWMSPMDRNLFFQLSGVYSNTHRLKSDSWEKPELFTTVDYTDNGYGYTSRTFDFIKDNFLIEAEFGIKTLLNNMTISFGLTIPIKQTFYKADYTYYENYVAIGTTRTRETQFAGWLNLAMPFEFVKWTKKVKPPKPEPELPPVLVLNDRKLKVQHNYTTSSKTLIIEVFDNASADGDTASVDFNGAWILENYPVNKEPKQLEITLKEGENQIALYAKSLGTTPPNTAAIAIIDGDKRKIFVLNSDYTSCGTLRIYKQE